ncbi:MAG TPA: hypothetical protein VK651_05460 [Blastocatellia bacterium]|nr:hypothetical protein [Blastocatellia bacterium]
MKSILLRRFTLFIAALGLAASLLLPAYAGAQGRGRGLTKKSQKFINGHDARAGRWDGRGPRPRLVWTSRRHRRHRGWIIRRQLTRRHRRVHVLRVR